MSRKLVKGTATVGGMTLISRMLGLLRDMVFARFGVDAGMDAFFVAFKIPNFMRRLFAEGAFSQAFVPVLTEYRSRGDDAQVRLLVDRVAGTLAGLVGLLVLVAVLASPVLVLVFAPGFWADPLKFELTAHMLRFTFPYLLFMALVAFAAGILNSYGRFGAAAFMSAVNCWSRNTVKPSFNVSWNQSRQVIRLPVQLWKYSCAMTPSIPR